MSTWPNTQPTGSESWTDSEIDNVLADLHPEDFAADVIRQLRGERDRARATAIDRDNEATEARARISGVLLLHQPHKYNDTSPNTYCVECSADDPYYDVQYPCPTVQALSANPEATDE